jgi:hypothetical protein
MPERKELHFFDNKWDRPLREYARHFEGGAGRIKGEITPAYGILPAERIRYLGRVVPRLRLVLMLRNPLERAWSHALMDLASRRGRDPDQVPFDEAPREQLYVGFFEWIRERPRELLSEVFRHIGVTTDVRWEDFPLDKVIVPGVAPGRKGHTTECLEPGEAAVESGRHPCPEPVRRWLEQRYADELERLAERLGGPARGWRLS